MRRTASEPARTGIALLAAGLALAACGGAKQHSSSTGSTNAGTATATAPGTPRPGGKGGTTPGGSSQVPPGAGGTEPVRAPAMLTGSRGRIIPATVQVAPFVAVAVTLTSGDGGSYSLTVAHKRLAVSAAHRTQTVTLPGLRPRQRYTARPSGGGAPITIMPAAEPGP